MTSLRLAGARLDPDNPWQLQGACRDADPELFFHPEGERGNARRKRDNAAKAICGGCPVAASCREEALAAREPYGVWGGLTERQREAIYARTRPAPKPVGRCSPPNKKKPPEVERMVLLLHLRGFNQPKIAALCRISRGCVRRILRDAAEAEREQVAS